MHTLPPHATTPLRSHALPALASTLASAHRLLAIAARHARERGGDEAALLSSRLAPDMFCLAHQARVLAESLDGALSLLEGDTAAPLAAFVFNRGDAAVLGEPDTRIEDALARLATAIARWRAVSPDTALAAPDAEILVCRPGHGRRFDTDGFVWRFLLPNAYFHLSMIHALLRAAGVPVGKGDYEGTPAWTLIPETMP
jgi:hypothetical protein